MRIVKTIIAYITKTEAKDDLFLSLLPTGLGYLNSKLRERGFHSSLANFSHQSKKSVRQFLKDKRPDLLALSIFTHNRIESVALAGMAKEINPACFVVAGGPHASARYGEILAMSDAIDAVIIGEGEETIVEVVEYLSQKKKHQKISEIAGLAVREEGTTIVSPQRPPIPDLNSLPFPATFMEGGYDIDNHRQLEFLITSRGCPASCLFCASPRFWGKAIRYRSPRNIVDEIKFIRDRFGLVYFSIRDDTFTSDRDRVIQFCKLLIKEKVHILWNCQSRVNSVDEEMLAWMKRAGCDCIQFGVESGSTRILKNLAKQITPDAILAAGSAARLVGLPVSIYLITGVPGESDDDISATCEVIEKMKPSDGQVSPLAFYPGTALFSRSVTAKEVKADLFETSSRDAFFVRQDEFVRRSTEKLLRQLEKTGAKSRFTLQEIAAQKRALGYCHATNIISGELAEARGDYTLAEREYREILDNEPHNPWGWIALAELLGNQGDLRGAADAFKKVVELVPRHLPALTALAEIYEMLGSPTKAAEYALLARNAEGK